MPPHVDLVPKKRHDVDIPHYDIFAGEQLVGVIGQPVPFAQREVWSWSLNTIMVDGSLASRSKAMRTASTARREISERFSMCGSVGYGHAAMGVEAPSYRQEPEGAFLSTRT